MKFSILTPSFNSSGSIEKAIDSVSSQLYSKFEHIIIDGGSSDGTTDILQNYKHVRWVSEPDQGQSDAMNKAFRMSTGDIIGYLNADDFYSKGTFKLVADAFEDHSVDIVVGDIFIKRQEVESRYVSDVTYRDILLHFRNRFPNNPVGYFYRRKVQEEVGNFPLDNHYTMDYWFILEAFRKFSVKKLDKVFGYFILSDDNKTSTINPIVECRNTALRHMLSHRDLTNLVRYIWFYMIDLKLK